MYHQNRPVEPTKPAYVPPQVVSYEVADLAKQLGPARAYSSGKVDPIEEELLGAGG